MQSSEENAPLWISDRVLNVSLVCKWQGYRNSVQTVFRIYVIRNMSQVLNIPRFCMYQESYCVRVSQGILKEVLISLGF